MAFSDTTKTIIIGGTSGIGRAVCDALDKRPGIVIAASRATGFDISDAASVQQFFDQTGAFDHLVVTAGSQAPGGAIADLDLASAKQEFDTKFWGSITTAKAAVPHLHAGGSITLTSGFLARRTVPGTFVKTAMNAALEASVKILAREIAPVRVNVVSPGLTDTEAYAGMPKEARTKMLEDAANSLPAGRVAQPEDLAAAYLFAIDSLSMTGAIIDIEGGALIN